MKRVKFECEHVAFLPHQATDPKWASYWASQSVPRIPGGVARCPGCVTGRRPQGEIQKVVSVEELPDEGQLF